MKKLRLERVTSGEYLGYEYILEKLDSTKLSARDIDELKRILNILVDLEYEDDSVAASDVSMAADTLLSALGEYLIQN